MCHHETYWATTSKEKVQRDSAKWRFTRKLKNQRRCPGWLWNAPFVFHLGSEVYINKGPMYLLPHEQRPSVKRCPSKARSTEETEERKDKNKRKKERKKERERERMKERNRKKKNCPIDILQAVKVLWWKIKRLRRGKIFILSSSATGTALHRQIIPFLFHICKFVELRY